MSDLLERLQAALADRYSVESEIGRGGMAVVFKAEDLRHHRQVAIKVLHPELAAAIGPGRFLREIEAVAGLTHPNVLPLHDSGEADGLLFYVMPYVEGDSLRQRLEGEGQLPVEQAIRITQEVAEALDHAHRRGLVHRDIKPGNILLEEGHAVVTDFGVARALSEAGEEKVTATGMSVGTPAYMSPEQASGEQVDARSDLYALGCVLYEMLAGEPPLVGLTPHSTAAKRLTDRPTPLPALRNTVPPELDQAVQKALQKSPADRYSTAPELAKALEDIPSGPDTSSRRRLWVELMAVTAIGALAIVGWLTFRSLDSAPPADQNSIAVLPFVNMSDDASNEYFSDGISEELLNLLATIPELHVTSRSSAFSFKNQALPIPEIAGRLNVAHILEGSVRKAGDEVRITAQLIDARSDTHVWSDTWDRTLDDIFKIQDEIAAQVVAKLRVTLLGKRPKIQEADPEAYILFLQAKQLFRQGTAESLQQSVARYQRALDIQPDYAAAWAGLAENYIRQAVSSGLSPIDEYLGLAREAANTALEIDPQCAEAYAGLSTLSRIEFDLAAAARYHERALALDPTNTGILLSAAYLEVLLGRLDEAVALAEYVVSRDPVNPGSHSMLGQTYMWAGRLDEAIASLRTAQRLSPGRIAGHYRIGTALLLNGEPEAALAEIEQETVEVWRLLGLAKAYHALGRVAESDAALEQLLAIEQETPGAAYNIAYVLAERGDADRAFKWLDRAVEYNDPGLPRVNADILFRNIHDDPRWLPFLESIGKSPEQLAAIDFEVTVPE